MKKQTHTNTNDAKIKTLQEYIKNRRLELGSPPRAPPRVAYHTNMLLRWTLTDTALNLNVATEGDLVIALGYITQRKECFEKAAKTLGSHIIFKWNSYTYEGESAWQRQRQCEVAHSTGGVKQ